MKLYVTRSFKNKKRRTKKWIKGPKYKWRLRMLYINLARKWTKDHIKLKKQTLH